MHRHISEVKALRRSKALQQLAVTTAVASLSSPPPPPNTSPPLLVPPPPPSLCKRSSSAAVSHELHLWPNNACALAALLRNSNLFPCKSLCCRPSAVVFTRRQLCCICCWRRSSCLPSSCHRAAFCSVSKQRLRIRSLCVRPRVRTHWQFRLRRRCLWRCCCRGGRHVCCRCFSAFKLQLQSL